MIQVIRIFLTALSIQDSATVRAKALDIGLGQLLHLDQIGILVGSSFMSASPVTTKATTVIDSGA